MSQKETTVDQHRKLREVKEWANGRLRANDDRQIRDALFAATQAIGLAMLDLEKVEYLTVDLPSFNDLQ